MPEQDYKNLTVDEVLEAVENGAISAEQALEYEKQGKARKTLVEALEELVNANQSTGDETLEPSSETIPEEEQSFITVKLIENVKLGRDLYKAGDKLGVDEEVYETLIKAKVIEIGD